MFPDTVDKTEPEAYQEILDSFCTLTITVFGAGQER